MFLGALILEWGKFKKAVGKYYEVGREINDGKWSLWLCNEPCVSSFVVIRVSKKRKTLLPTVEFTCAEIVVSVERV